MAAETLLLSNGAVANGDLSPNPNPNPYPNSNPNSNPNPTNKSRDTERRLRRCRKQKKDSKASQAPSSDADDDDSSTGMMRLHPFVYFGLWLSLGYDFRKHKYAQLQNFSSKSVCTLPSKVERRKLKGSGLVCGFGVVSLLRQQISFFLVPANVADFLGKVTARFEQQEDFSLRGGFPCRRWHGS
ncbi:hypothetical protein CMV_010362 [Castanea mollissima]|uniref:Uncharacterized protein n=2 Tax=Castanea mollissima TaxID=60419 RepID=A0A8J4RN11_9ROSI|nr:hypothetical protein CMV_010362 [Castanea mollissima]